METLLAIIFIIFGVLQIILFFKVWGMTNNIEKIKKQICPPPSLNGVRRLILKGETDKAKEALTDALISDIENCNTTNCTSVKKIKDVYKLLFDKLGFEFPEEIDKIVSYSHYRSIL